jgi:hypothetical protein
VATVLGPAPERHFGWIGAAVGTAGIILGAVSLFLGINGWEITRLWFYLLGSAMFVLVGVQLILFRMLIRVLDTLNEREERIGEDLMGAKSSAPAITAMRRPLASGTD